MTVYTAEDIYRDLTAKMLLMLEDVRECVEKRQLSDAMAKEKARLARLGLTGTKNASIINEKFSEIEAYNKKVDRLNFMNEVWNTFGHDVMVVSYEDFLKVLEKYDHICGDLSHYTGFIPEKNLKEIERVMDMDVPERFATDIKVAREVFTSFIGRARRMPYNTNPNILGVSEWNDNTFRFFIAAPAKEMGGYGIRVYNYSFHYTVNTSKSDNEIQIIARDPFFCSCSEHGVVIYSKWGDEAQDELISRYQELSDTINKSIEQ